VAPAPFLYQKALGRDFTDVPLNWAKGWLLSWALGRQALGTALPALPPRGVEHPIETSRESTKVRRHEAQGVGTRSEEIKKSEDAS